MVELEDIFALDPHAGRVQRAGAKVVTPDCGKIPSGSTVLQLASLFISAKDPSSLDSVLPLYSHH